MITRGISHAKNKQRRKVCEACRGGRRMNILDILDEWEAREPKDIKCVVVGKDEIRRLRKRLINTPLPFGDELIKHDGLKGEAE